MDSKVYTAIRTQVPVLLCAAAMLLALLALAGWLFYIPVLKQPVPHVPAMNPLSAILFILLVTAICLLNTARSRPVLYRGVQGIAVMVLVTALLRCADILLHLGLDMDRLVFAGRINAESEYSFAGGMNIITAIGFVKLSLALLLSAFNHQQLKRAANFIAFLALCIGLFALLGYLYAVPEFFYLLSNLPISIQSAVCFGLLPLAIFLINANAAFMQTISSPLLGGKLARRLIPAVLIVPVTMGFIRLWLYWHHAFSVELGVAILMAFIVIIFFGLVWYLAMRLNASDNARTLAEEELRQFNENLAAMVTERTQKLEESSARYKQTLDGLIEGVQMIDYNWRYTYVNSALVAQSTYTRDQLMGKTILENYPGVESTPLFATLKECMEERTAHLIENEFNFPNGTTKHFVLSVQPIPEGIFILSVDVTAQHNSTQHVLKLNRLYKFLSEVNQAIVHVTDQQQLFTTICNTATGVGQFKSAWVGMLNQQAELDIVAMAGHPLMGNNPHSYTNLDYRSEEVYNTIPAKVLRTGKYVYTNDTPNEPGMESRRHLMEKAGINSSIALPLKKFGVVVGMLAFHSDAKNFFDEDEIALLDEAAGDISFALEFLDKEQQRILAQHKLTESEILLKRAQQIAHVGHWNLNLVTGYTVWSEEATRIYGNYLFRNTQWLPEWKTFLHPEDAESVMAAIRVAKKSLTDFSMEHRIVLRNGAVRHLHSQARFEFNGAGKPVNLYGIIRDITDIKLQQEAIQKSEANLLALIENTSDFIYSLDVHFRYITFNSHIKNTVQQFYGVDIQPGMLVYEFLKKLDPADAHEWKLKYTEAITGKVLQFVKEYNIGGQLSFTQFFINPIWQGEKVIGLSCVGRDITTQKLAELEIKALNESLEKKVRERTEQLEEANKELETFSYTVSHDLQAPLRALSGFSKILVADYSDKLDAEGKDFLKVIDTSANRMGQLIRDLLAFAQLGKQPFKIQAIDMTELAQAAVNDVSRHTENFNATVNIKPLVSCNCDANLMLQVWVNLIGNAVKYSAKVARPLVEIGITDKDNKTVYYIKDNGAGFDMRHADKLFAAFQRLHGISDFEGSGIGLSTVHRIITRHGGTIWAESEPNKGATFYFTLPQ
jgi:PAS domain S-box-containing protein